MSEDAFDHDQEVAARTGAEIAQRLEADADALEPGPYAAALRSAARIARAYRLEPAREGS